MGQHTVVDGSEREAKLSGYRVEPWSRARARGEVLHRFQHKEDACGAGAGAEVQGEETVCENSKAGRDDGPGLGARGRAHSTR